MNFDEFGRFDLHLHTRFSDGKNTPEEMVQAALAHGLNTIGFSDHSYTSHDTSYCLPKERIGDYLAEISRLKEKYAGKIRILCGIEQDLYGDFPTDCFDYCIGSVHYVEKDGLRMDVDHSPARFAAYVAQQFGGDHIAFAEAYFENVGKAAEKIRPDIVGHFDLVSKFNEGEKLFDESNPRYIAAWKKAADRALVHCRVFECNTGAIARGYRTSPYPSAPIREYLRSRGARLILSSDAHKAGNIAFQFDKWQ